jgi:hypothetical protein
MAPRREKIQLDDEGGQLVDDVRHEPANVDLYYMHFF